MNRNNKPLWNIIMFFISVIAFTQITGQRISTPRYPPGSLSHRIEQLKAERNVDGLLDLLDTQDPVATHLVIIAIGEIGDEKAVETLIDLVKNPTNWLERVKSSEALAKIAPPEAFGPITEALKDECSVQRPEDIVPAVRRDAGTADEAIERWMVLALNNFISKNKEKYFPLLETQMKDENLPPKYRYHIAIIIAQHKRKSALHPVVECLSGCESGMMREWAAGSLEALGDIRAIEPLIMALEDEYVPESHGDVKKNYGYTVRLASYAALKTLGVDVIKKGDTYIVKD